MVFFTCEKCGEALKKKQVCRHFSRCNSNSFSCIDCQKVFDGNSYNEHIKCISENQKYGGANFVAKENKGEVRQNLWLEQVLKAIDNVEDPNLKKFLCKIQGYDNVPRKEKKFLNFMKCCLKKYDEDLCKKAWNAITKEVEKTKLINAKESKEQTNTEIKESNGDNCNNNSNQTNEVTNNNNNENKSNQFKWKSTIKRKLNDNNNISLKKLKTDVLNEYKQTLNEEVDEAVLNSIFYKKLELLDVQIVS